jgi:hypothetical protein
MKMPARLLFRCAAGMENGRSFFWRDAGQLQFFERRGGYERDFRPVLNDVRHQATRFANDLVSGIVPALQREKFEGQVVELMVRNLPVPGKLKSSGKM